MVKAFININKNTNRILNMIKASYNLKAESDAINIMAKEYEELVFIPKIKSSYLERFKKISKEKDVYMGSISDFDKRFHIKK